jgi:hypothetical protein
VYGGSRHTRDMEQAPYRFDELGWLQFERLCVEILGGAGPLVAEGLPGLPGPTLVVVAWLHRRAHRERRLQSAVARARDEWAYAAPRSVIVFTNVSEEVDADAVIGPRELTEIVASRPELRLRVPSVLGIYDVRATVDTSRSTLDVDAAAELARVFVPTRAYARTRDVLARNAFAVVTGPPEMGKTAIARTIALAKLTAGWEAHECIRPEELWDRFARDRAQVFVADDAFGSTEYRPEAAERWALDLDRVLRAMDERHWLIWTSRPAPLKAGLRRIHREHGVEHWPQPAEVHVDAAALDVAEKALILFRHAKAAALPAPEVVRRQGWRIVSHEHFTPERIRRFVARVQELDLAADLEAVVAAEIREPTAAMKASFRALADDHRALLVAMLDTPPGPVSERDLVAATRRHSNAGFAKPPTEIVDRLGDHFLRAVESGGVTWVHPSWRDLVIEELATNPDARRRFLHAAGIDGALLALSTAGGAGGERVFPLLLADADWDALGDRLAELVPDLDEPGMTRLVVALAEAHEQDRTGEVDALARYVLELLARRWDRERAVIPVGVLAEWFELGAELTEAPAAPKLGPTWVELAPTADLDVDSPADVARLDQWATLTELVGMTGDRAGDAIYAFVKRAKAAARLGDPAVDRDLLIDVLRRLNRIAPHHAYEAPEVIVLLIESAPGPELPPVELHPLPADLAQILDAPSLLPRNDEAFVAKVLRDL